jgi:hypothetical protein
MVPHPWIAGLIFSWLGFLTFAWVWLFIDRRGKRRAIAVGEATIAALQRHVASQEAAIGRLTSALAGMAPLALVDDASEPAEGDPAPASATRQSTPTLQRMALVPAAPSVAVPPSEPPPSSSEAFVRDAPRIVPVEVARDERRTVEVLHVANDTAGPVEVGLDDQDELRRLLLSCPFPDGRTMAKCIRDKVADVLGSAETAKHCEGTSCFPGAWSVCACPCIACSARRCVLSDVQRLFKGRMPFVRLPGEKPEAWELRRAYEESPRTSAPSPPRWCSVEPAHPVALMSAALVSHVQHRIDARFVAMVDRAVHAGVDTKHCRGSECDPNKATCSCPCIPCDRRRTLYEQAETEVMAPTGEAAERAREQSPTLGAKVEQRWHELQILAEVNGKPAFHCESGTCGGESATICECVCEGCVRALDLLIHAEREVLGGEG